MMYVLIEISKEVGTRSGKILTSSWALEGKRMVCRFDYGSIEYVSNSKMIWKRSSSLLDV